MEKFIDPTASYRNNLHKMLPPVADSSLLYIGIFGQNATESARNYAINQPDVSILGAPTYSANSITVDANDYLQLGFADSADITLIMAMRLRAAYSTNRSLVFSNSGTPNTNGGGTTGNVQGRGLYVDGSANSFTPAYQRGYLTTATPPATTSSGGVLSTGSILTSTNFGQPVVVSGRSRSSDLHQQFNNLTLNQVGNAQVTPGTIEVGGAYRIGSSASSTLNGQSQAVECFMALAYSRYLADAELTSVYTFMQTYLASVGITV